MKNSVFSKIYIAFVLVLIYLPMALVVIYSFNGSKISTVWNDFSFKWYLELFRNKEMASAIKNSLIIATVCSLLSAALGTVAAVGIYKSRSLIDKGVKRLATVPLMMPEIITGMIFLTLFSALGIKMGMFTIILAHCSFCIPYVIMTVNSSLEQLDISTLDAARDLGAGRIRSFFEITVPQLASGIISGALLSFAMSMDDVVISFFVTGPATNTLPVKIFSQLRKGVTPEINALCTLMLAVTILLGVAAKVVRGGGKAKKVSQQLKGME